MRGIFALALACFFIMSAALAWGFTSGDFWREGAILTSLPWGIISIVDIYTGGALFAGWIAYREHSIARTALWIVLILVLGHWSTSLYVLLALASSEGDVQRFWMGGHLEAVDRT
ncbi:hypothetical protein BH23ACI1_BH23ACI1_14330 [soil metagenome]